MFTYEELSGFLNDYQQSLNKYQELTDRLLLPCSHEEWMKLLEERSGVIRETFARNAEWFPRIYAELEDMTWDKARIFFNAVTDIFYAGYTYIDYPLATDILERLVPVFEAEAPMGVRIILYSALSYLYAGYYDTLMGAENSGGARKYAEKVVSCREQYPQMADDKDARINIWVMYTNLLSGIAELDDIPFETLVGWYNEMLTFWNSELVQGMDRKDEDFLYWIEYGRACFLGSAYRIMVKRLEAAGREEYGRCLEDMEEKLRPLLEDADSSGTPWYCRCILDAAKGEQRAVELVYRFVDEFEGDGDDGAAEKEYQELVEQGTELDAKLEFFRAMLKLAALDGEEKRRLSDRILPLFLRRMREIPGTFDKGWIDGFYADFFCGILPYLDTFQEKESMLEKLIICRQPQTFIHSCMVEKLAVMAAEVIIEKAPGIFAGIPGYETAEKLLDKKEEFLAYVARCGTFHDIGKCEVAGVINMQMHKVTDMEFACIKRHPWCGVRALEDDPAFVPYIQVILGHHKTYDGTRGYPADFDVLSSPYKPVIDLISICDSLDAATDQLGRNYNKAKSFDTVLGEFRQGAGTRYNPDIVKVIEEDAALQERMSHLVTDGRADAYYEAYRQCQNFAEMTL